PVHQSHTTRYSHLSLHDALPISPRFASTSRAASLTAIGSVLVSITIVPRFAEAASSAATSARARAEGSEVTMRSARLATSLGLLDRKSTRLNSSHVAISYAVFCL